jgi:hypothetical protein
MEQLDLFKAYFNEETDYYVEKLMRFQNGQKYSFNFWAGFLGIIWLAYRKMYREAGIILVVILLAGFLLRSVLSSFNPASLSNSRIADTILSIVYFIIIGITGNYLYLSKVNKIVNDYISSNQIEIIGCNHIDELSHKGGTNLFAAGVCFVLLILVPLFFRLMT